MPSISDIFGSPGIDEENNTDFDLDKFFSEADKLIESKNAELETPAPEVATTTEGAPSSAGVGDAEEAPPSGRGDEGSGAEPPPPDAVLAPAPDPLAEIPAERRAQLLALDEYMREHPDALSRIVEPVAEPKPPEPPTLPDHIDPGSVEAELWLGQQEQKRMLLEQKTMLDQQAQERAADRLAQVSQQAAISAGNTFAARYEGKLTRDDVLAIAQVAGQGIAGRLAAQAKTPEEITAAYDEALEHVLWKTPEYREKAIGPIVAAPDPLTPKQADKAAAPDRKRKLTALSGAASPVAGAPAGRSPLQTREDGRLTGQSRMDLVKSLASQLRGNSEGT
jgi:hypothetical protein